MITHFFCLFLLIFSIFLFPTNCFGQLLDQFEDGDFTKNPAWQGDEKDFIVNNNHQLQLMAQGAGISYLATPSPEIDKADWTVYVELGFNPSSQNYARVYLTSDRSNLSGPLNGYFVKIGGSEDEVSLYKQAGKEITKIIDGQDKRLDINAVKAKISVSRTPNGKWTLWSAIGDTANFLKEGSAKDLAFLGSAYAGVFCVYTTTRRNKFYFDDLKVKSGAVEDTVPPDLLEVRFKTNKTLQLIFSEPLAIASAGTLQNYDLRPEIGQLKKVTLEEDEGNIVTLSFDEPLKVGNTYTLSIESVSDTLGNKAGSFTKSFLFFLEGEANYREVVINELMADPTPRVGLPEKEFIELFNNSENAFNLKGWQIYDNESAVILDNYLLFPDEYLILCAITDTALFKTYGSTMGLSSWLSLNNGGDNISLANEQGQIIDQVNYEDKWYRSSIRDNGGYTLEMIDPSNPCSKADNWKASESRFGGSPGQINSIYAHKPDLKGPIIEQVFPINASTLVLFFNEGLDTATIEQAEYFIDKTLAQVVGRAGDGETSIVLVLSNALEAGKRYTIEIHKIKDCNGNYIENGNNEFTFGLPEDAASNDVIINEVLFNPKINGVDFVEIYNNSKKYLDLQNWTLANTSIEEETGMEITDNRKVITKENFLFAPGALLVLTSSIDQTLKDYPKGAAENMVEIASLPGYPDQSGTVLLSNQENMLIDRFDYSDDYHSPILGDVEGVSLERIAYKEPTQNPQNWASSASVNGFATPGKYNAQSRTMKDEIGEIHVDPKVITPDNNGLNDFTTIQYLFRNHGYVANIFVYDAEGRRVCKIIANQTLGTSGFFTWEGTDDSHRKVKMGVYMIYIEIFNLNGTVKVFKEPIVIDKEL